MSISSLVEIIHSNSLDQWPERNNQAFDRLFGAPDGRYPKEARKTVEVRAPGMAVESGVPFAALIHPTNPKSGPYSGLSFVIFPLRGKPSLIGLVVGTQGLSPDDAILGRPGHARKCQAICKWLNVSFGNGELVAWAKHDPTRTDLEIPKLENWSEYKNIFERYGKELYAVYRPIENHSATEQALTVFIDLLLEERGYEPMAAYKHSSEDLKASWFKYLLPSLEEDRVLNLLNQRRFVIIQGPPGTGKTHLAKKILQGAYENFGRTIQFHPNVTYESFIGGLAPAQSADGIGFRFKPEPGFLMQSALAAKNDKRNYLLHIATKSIEPIWARSWEKRFSC